MGKIRLTFLLVLMTLLAACGLKPIPIDDDSVDIPPGVQIVYPLDQETLGQYHAAVVAVASLPSGIGGMEFSIDGNAPFMYEFPSHKIGADYVENYAYWFPAHMGSTILSVVVFDMNGQPVLSDQIEVFVEFEDPVDDQIKTQVAQTLAAITSDEEVEPSPTPTSTLTPTPSSLNPNNSPCELIDPDEIKLTLHDIRPGSFELTYFLDLGIEVPGLESRETGDDQLYVYTAFLGTASPVECSYQGYTRRIYCTQLIEESALDSVQPLTVKLNLCDQYIYYHPRVSLIAPVCTRERN